MLSALHSEVFRLVRRRMPWILLAFMAGTVLVLYSIMWFSAQSSQFSTAERADLIDSLALHSVLETGLSLAALLGSLFVIILSASLAATEYDWGTVRTLLPRTAGRTTYLLAKVTVLAGFALAVVLAGVAATVTGATAVTILEGLGFNLGLAFLGDMVMGIARIWITTLPYLALAFLVALLAKSSAAGISVGAAVLFLEGQILQLVGAIGGIFERVPELLLARNAEALIAVGGSNDTLPGPWRAALVLLAYMVAFVALAVWRFTRRDVTVD